MRAHQSHAQSAQSSAGQIPHREQKDFRAEYDIGHLVDHSAPGYARIEAFFTQKCTAADRNVVRPFCKNFGITSSRKMKTAISINDELLQQADQTARMMGLSRSRLFAIAVGDFLQRRQQEQMLLRLNEVYANGEAPAEKRLLKGMKAKLRRTVKERW